MERIICIWGLTMTTMSLIAELLTLNSVWEPDLLCELKCYGKGFILRLRVLCDKASPLQEKLAFRTGTVNVVVHRNGSFIMTYNLSIESTTLVLSCWQCLWYEWWLWYQPWIYHFAAHRQRQRQRTRRNYGKCIDNKCLILFP